MSAGPSEPDQDVPEDFDKLRFLSPEQYEVLRKAREEQQRDLSPEQVEALLRELAQSGS